MSEQNFSKSKLNLHQIPTVTKNVNKFGLTVMENLYILRSRYANEAEGLEYNGKQCKSFGHELVLGAFGDRPETFPRGSPICLDGTGLGRFFFQFFFAEQIDFF